MGNRDPHHKILIPQQQFEFSPFGPHYAGHNELTIAERIKTFNRQLSILTKKSFNLYSDFDARLLLRFVYDDMIPQVRFQWLTILMAMIHRVVNDYTGSN